METFDYIIVGGGTAGCILANRLTANGKYRVLLLEAGGEPKSMWIKIPAGFSKLLVNPIYNWRFFSEPEPNTYGRKISIPRGKGLGGSTLINGMIYVRGQHQDYDHWEKLGAKGWGAAGVMPYFKKFENYLLGADDRGRQGPMGIHEVSERYELTNSFLRAAQSKGYPLNSDYNSQVQDGFCYYQVSQKNGQRWSVYDGYLKPARSRSNLVIEKNAHVLRLEVDGTTCQGVTFRQNHQDKTVYAKMEVIMAAGAIQTPQILELSGIGNPELLKQYGIPVKVASPYVGENYIDHYATRMNWKIKNTLTINETSRGLHLVKAVINYFTKRRGILTLGTGLVGGFVKTKAELATPDVQYFVMTASYADASKRILDTHPGLTIGVAQLRPKSVGSIHIKANDPYVEPRISPNFLAEKEDQEALIGGMKIAREIMADQQLAKFVDAEKSPGLTVANDDAWLDFARENGQTIYHPIGTCKMGEDERAVVDSRLKFKGMTKLRVVDASIMPTIVSGNTQAAVMMIAEKASDMILEDASR